MDNRDRLVLKKIFDRAHKAIEGSPEYAKLGRHVDSLPNLLRGQSEQMAEYVTRQHRALNSVDIALRELRNASKELV